MMDIEEIVPVEDRPKPRARFQRPEEPYVATNDPVRFMRMQQRGKLHTGIHVVEVRRIDAIPDGFAVLVKPGELMMSWPVYDYRTETERRLDPMYQIALRNGRAALLGTLNAILEEAFDCGGCDGHGGIILGGSYEYPPEPQECSYCEGQGRVFDWSPFYKGYSEPDWGWEV